MRSPPGRCRPQCPSACKTLKAKAERETACASEAGHCATSTALGEKSPNVDRWRWYLLLSGVIINSKLFFIWLCRVLVDITRRHLSTSCLFPRACHWCRLILPLLQFVQCTKFGRQTGLDSLDSTRADCGSSSSSGSGDSGRQR